jgi:DNA-binding transcriptional MerR regulator
MLIYNAIKAMKEVSFVMQSSSITWMASKDVAVKLEVHVRTLRNWIDAFSPYMVLQKNSQGHLLLSEQAYNLLVEIKKRKDAGVQTLKEIEDSLRTDGLLPERIETEDLTPVPSHNEVPVQAAAAIMEKLSELESSINQHFYESIHEFTESYRQTASSMELVVLEASRSQRTSPASIRSGAASAEIEQQYKNIMRKMEEIEDKQENIRLEMRKMNFDIQMIGAADKLNKKHRKINFFGSLFRKAPQISSDYHS